MAADVPSGDGVGNANRGRRGGMRVVIRPYPATTHGLLRPRGEAHLWIAGPDRGSPEVSLLRERLTPSELARASQYKHPRPRDQFVRCRGLLRGLLGGYLGCDSQEVVIETGPDGKPILIDVRNAPLHFNVSHTEGLAVFAVADRPIGVDVEAVRPVPTADDLVQRFFTTGEAAQYRALSGTLREAAFFRGWTCKEAVLKGIGCGARQLDRCSVDLDPARPASVVGPPDTAAAWAVATWIPASGFVGAVAIAASAPLQIEQGRDVKGMLHDTSILSDT